MITRYKLSKRTYRIFMQNITEHERNITLQLLFEFKVICHTYKVELISPVIELVETKGCLGRWRTECRTISINKHYIENTTWENVIEVLKHEMAHQLCSEVFYSNKKSHGKDFQRACEILMVKKSFRQASLGPESSDEYLKISVKDDNPKLQKIFKLLDLSRSTNVFEAEMAFAKAQQMMHKYNFTENDLEYDDVVKHEIINLKKKKVKRFQSRIAGIVSKYFYVEIIRAETYDQQSNSIYKTFEIAGRGSNVDIALHCYYYLNNRLKELWKKCDLSLRKGNTLRLKNSYYLGVLDGVEKKLIIEEKGKDRGTEINEGPCSSLSEILVLSDVSVQQYIKRRHPHLRKRKNRVLNIDALMYNAGATAGKKISLHKTIIKGSGKIKYLTS